MIFVQVQFSADYDAALGSQLSMYLESTSSIPVLFSDFTVLCLTQVRPTRKAPEESLVKLPVWW